jgi:hypothetical protein
MANSIARKTDRAELSAEQQQQAELILQHLRTHADQHLQELALLLASKPDCELFGKTEFEARDIIHRIGADAMQAALESRQKKGLSGC